MSYKNMSYRNRADLGEEHSWTDAGQLIILGLFLAIWILDSFVFKFSTFLNKYIPSFINLSLAGALLVIWAYMSVTGLKTVFGTVRETPHVITAGLFGIFRHPIYFASMVFFTGLALSTLSLISICLLFPIFLFYNHVSAFEEKKLIEKYGEEYRKFIGSNYRWVPFLRRRQART